MKSLKPLLYTLLGGVFLSASANAATMTWDFTVEVEEIYRDDANVIDDSIVAGSLLQGRFSYDNGLTENSPGNDYVDGYESPTSSISINGLGIHDLSVEVSVVHQDSRDIVDAVGDYYSGDIWEQIEIGFLDYSQSYDNGVLPTNWHLPPVPFTDIEFDYTYDIGTDPCCSDSWLQGKVIDITLRQPTHVPEPSSMALILAGSLLLTARRFKR